MRRFLLHVLPGGFHRIRHYGLFANPGRKENLAKARELIHVAPQGDVSSRADDAPLASLPPTFVCPDWRDLLWTCAGFLHDLRPL